jgi:hypothetical protein
VNPCDFKVSVAYQIALGFEMLATVDLNDKPCLEADEVDDVKIDRLLSAETPSG